MSKKFGNGIDLQNRPIDNVADPSSAQQAATKNYVDNVVRGMDWKAEVIAASTGNVSVSAPGTAIDGVTLSAGMQVLPVLGTVTRVLLKDQTTASENGIYDWNGSGAPMTRSTDADSGTELSGSTVTVQRGTVNADRVYRVTTDDTLTIGTTAVTLAQVGGGSAAKSAGNGLTETGSTYDVGAGTGISVTADAVAIDTTVVARKYSTTIGNGSLTSIAITHNLGTTRPLVSFYYVSGNEEFETDWVATDANTVTATFATAPATGAVAVSVIG